MQSRMTTPSQCKEEQLERNSRWGKERRWKANCRLNVVWCTGQPLDFHAQDLGWFLLSAVNSLSTTLIPALSYVAGDVSLTSCSARCLAQAPKPVHDLPNLVHQHQHSNAYNTNSRTSIPHPAKPVFTLGHSPMPTSTTGKLY